MKVLHVLGCIDKGGTENFVFNHMNWLKQNVEPVFMTIGSRPKAYKQLLESNQWKVYVAPKWKLSKAIRMFWFLRNIIRQEKVEIVHSHLNVDNYFIMLFSYILGIKKRISHSHDVAGMESKSKFKRFFNKGKALVNRLFSTDYLACSNEAGYYLFGKKFKKKGIVINNGIDIHRFVQNNYQRVQNLKSEYDLNDKIIIGNISRFEPKKNQIFIIEVFWKLLKRDPKYILVLGGTDSGMLQQVREKIKEMKLEKSVRILGKVEEMETWLQIFDVFVFPSQFEGLGIVLLECQACGTPFVSSNRVPQEVDLGLGLAKFLSLDCEKEVWVEEIEKSLKCKQTNFDKITQAFVQKKFLLEESAQQLEEVYIREIKKG